MRPPQEMSPILLLALKPIKELSHSQGHVRSDKRGKGHYPKGAARPTQQIEAGLGDKSRPGKPEIRLNILEFVDLLYPLRTQDIAFW